MYDLHTLQSAVSVAITQFEHNDLLRKLRGREATKSDYVALLEQLFFQTREGAASLALAGARCPNSQWRAREYLFAHADEEKTHWRWIMDDLRSLDSLTPDLETRFPRTATAAYIAFNFYVAEAMPISRLAIAMVLEGIAETFGPPIGQLAVGNIGIKLDQMTFFRSHSQTDVQHSEDLRVLFRDLRLSEQEWAHAAFAATVAGQLYSGIYNSIAVA